MSYNYNGNFNASSANGGYPTRGGQGNGIAPAARGHSVQHPQPHQQQPRVLHQQLRATHQQPSAPPQSAPLPPARAPPPPPIHFVLDRQYTLCRAPSPPAQPAPQHVPAAVAPHYAPAAHYTPTRNVPQHTPARDGHHYAPTSSNAARYVPPALRNAAHYTPSGNAAQYTPAGNGAHYVPAPPPPAPAPALVPFRCAHPQCGGRVVMVASAREHMWAAHRVRV